jgi:hypothetical protein
MLERQPNQVQQEAHLGPGIVQSMKKYENIKLQNFIETLYLQNASVERFSQEIERFFFYHSIRKTKVIQNLSEQYKGQRQVRQQLVNGHLRGTAPKEYIQAQNKNYNLLYQLFVQKFNEIREDIRTRRTFTMLSNTKSLKIRTDKIEIPDINSISIQMFKPQDKKMLIDLFCNDEAVQQIAEDILNSFSNNNNDLTNVDMMSHINTNTED